MFYNSIDIRKILIPEKEETDVGFKYFLSTESLFLPKRPFLRLKEEAVFLSEQGAVSPSTL